MIEKCTFSIENRSLNYNKVGRGTPVLFLHGFPDNADVWDFQLPYIGEDFLAIAPHLYGTDGGKDYGKDCHRLENYCADVLQLMESLSGGKSFYVVAHDLGGPQAGWIAENFPNLVKGMIFVNSVTSRQFLYRKKYMNQMFKSYYMLLFQAPIVTANLLGKVHKFLLNSAYDLSNVPKDDPIRLSGPYVFKGIDQYRILFRDIPKLLKEKYEKISTPTFLIYGNKDPYLNPATREEIDSIYKNASCEVIDGGHWVHRSSPKEINDRILQKLNIWEGQ